MNNDLISRKWLTDAIRNRRTYLSYEDAKDVIDLIDNAPTVEPFERIGSICEENCGYRPQGEWIDKQYWFGHCSAECSNCGKRADGNAKDTGFGYEYLFYNFCPNCGANMKGGAE